MADGEIRIDARIDDEEVEKGLNDIEKDVDKSLKKIEKQFDKSSTNVNADIKNVSSTAKSELENKIADSAEKAAQSLQSELGKGLIKMREILSKNLKLSENDLKEFSKISVNLLKNGFGDSAEHAANSIIKIKQQLGKLSPAEIEELALSTLELTRNFDVKLDNAIDKVIKVMNEFKVDGKTAINIVEAELTALGQEAKNTSNKIDKANNDAKKSFKDLANAVKETGEKVKDLGGKITAGLTLPIAGVGGIAAKAAIDFDSAMSKIQNALGETEKQSEQLAELAELVWRDGFGESLDDVVNALIQVKQNMKDLPNSEIKEATKNALILAQTYDSEVNEVTRAGNNLMKHFGLTAKESFDLMAFGAQNGLNFSNELFDNLSEYAPLFSDLGFSAKEYFQLLIQGADQGIYNLDFLNDLVKEFNIRIRDGSKTTEEAVAQLSSGTQDLFKRFKNGEVTAKDMFNAIIADLKNLDEYTANIIGVELFGTKWEDMGGDVVLALGGIDGELKNLDGTMSDMAKVSEETFGQRLSSMMRETQAALKPFSDIILDIADKYMPKIIQKIQELSNWFRQLNPAIQQGIIIFGGLIAILGPLLAVIGFIIQGIGVLIPIFTALASPIGIVIGLIAGLIALFTYLWTTNEQFREAIIEIWNGIVEGLTEILTPFIESFVELWTTLKDTLIEIGTELWEFLVELWDTHLKGIVENVTQFVEKVFELVRILWEDYVKPAFESALEFLVDLWNGGFGKMVRKVIEFIASLAKNATELFNKFIMPIVNFLAQVLQPAFSIAFNTILGFFGGFFNSVGEIVSGILKVFDGVITFITGVFTLNWEKAWEGVKKIFSGIWDTFVAIVKAPINVIIGLINGFIKGLNKIKIPNWVPGVGGKGINIPLIPQLAKGGNVFGDGAFIAGEAGPELFEKKGAQVRVTPLTDAQKSQVNGYGKTSTPANINLMLGNREYNVFVDDIMNTSTRKQYRLKRGKGVGGVIYDNI